jgi:hypothetical protein
VELNNEITECMVKLSECVERQMKHMVCMRAKNSCKSERVRHADS